MVRLPVVRANAGELPPAIEAMLWHYAYGKPKEQVEHVSWGSGRHAQDARPHIVVAGPPDGSIRWSEPAAKNATDRLSGDQKGAAAPSVPGSSAAVSESSGRTHRLLRPCSFPATNAT